MRPDDPRRQFYSNGAFMNALREVLGLAPIYWEKPSERRRGNIENQSQEDRLSGGIQAAE